MRVVSERSNFLSSANFFSSRALSDVSYPCSQQRLSDHVPMQTIQTIMDLGRQLAFISLEHYFKLLYPFVEICGFFTNTLYFLQYKFHITLTKLEVRKRDSHLYGQRSLRALQRPLSGEQRHPRPERLPLSTPLRP